jgi:hypothetical protein
MRRELREMQTFPEWRCRICDQNMKPGQRWFAIAEDRGKDTLSVFHREAVGSCKSVHSVCSTAHVSELVVHWMVTGSLDYPFADDGTNRKPANHLLPLWERTGNVQPSAIGELAIDREAMRRVLCENPGAVLAMLTELVEALERSVAVPAQGVELVEGTESLIPRI